MKKVLLALAVIIILAGGFFAWKFFGPAASSPNNKFLYIPTGSDMNDVRNELVKNSRIGIEQ